MGKTINGDVELAAPESAKPSSMHFMLAAYVVIQPNENGGDFRPNYSFRKSANPAKLKQIVLEKALPMGDESEANIARQPVKGVPAPKEMPRASRGTGGEKGKMEAEQKYKAMEEVDCDDSALFDTSVPPAVAVTDGAIMEEQASEQPRPPQYWIDVEIPGHDPRHDLESSMPHLLETVVKPCLKSLEHDSDLVFLKQHTSDFRQWQTPQALPLPNAAFVVMRILQVDESGDDDCHVVRHAAALCLPNRLITVASSASSLLDHHSKNTTKKPLSALDDTLQEVLVKKSQQLLEESISGCVLLWLNFHCNRTQSAVHRLRETIYELFEIMTHNVEKLDTKDVAACKDRLLRISAVAEEQNECIQALVEGGDAVCDAITFDENPTLQGALNVIKQGAASTERHVLRLEKRIADLEQALDAYAQKRINGRLNTLTVLSAIFLPLTLMTGLYGMNFVNIPELNYEYGYFVLWGCMIFVASSLLLFFWRAGWCKN